MSGDPTSKPKKRNSAPSCPSTMSRPLTIAQPRSRAAARKGVTSGLVVTSPTIAPARRPVDRPRQRVVGPHARRRGVDEQVEARRLAAGPRAPPARGTRAAGRRRARPPSRDRARGPISTRYPPPPARTRSRAPRRRRRAAPRAGRAPRGRAAATRGRSPVRRTSHPATARPASRRAALIAPTRRAVSVASSTSGSAARLVRHGEDHAVEVAHTFKPSDRCREIRRRALDRHEDRVDAVPLERRVERLGRTDLGDRVTEDDDRAASRRRSL